MKINLLERFNSQKPSTAKINEVGPDKTPISPDEGLALSVNENLLKLAKGRPLGGEAAGYSDSKKYTDILTSKKEF